MKVYIFRQNITKEIASEMILEKMAILYLQRFFGGHF